MFTLPKPLALSLITTVAACSLTSVVYKELPDEVSVTVTGLQGSGLVLTNNGADDLLITGDGAFSFASRVERAAAYSVAVKTQPSNPTQICTVSHGIGTTGDGNVTDVQVSCSLVAFSVGGTVTGLRGRGSVLQNSAGDDLAVNADGTFTFATPMASGASYEVTVRTQPALPTQVCMVDHGSGTVGDANITNVVVSCATSAYTVGGTVTGLVGTGLLLRNNGGDDLAISGDGGFTFAVPVASGATFEITAVGQPAQPTQVCTVARGTGAVTAGNIEDVAVTCATSSFTIGGTVTGVAGTGLVLRDNGGDDLAISANGSFTFTTAVASNANYEVTVAASPVQPSQRCTVTNGAGVVADSNLTNIEVTCATSSFPVGGTVTGLAGAGLVIQSNNGDDLAITGNGNFTFATPVASGATFHVTVLRQPSQPSQTCTVLGDSGTVGDGAVTSVAINCATNRYMISGTISGLVGTVTLQNNGGDDRDITSNGTFAFGASMLSGSAYHVTVKTQPSVPSQTCTVTNGSGTVGGANITNVTVTCATNSFTVGGTVSGLGLGDTITLRNNGGDSLVRSANGGFTFTTPIASGQSYAVTVVSPTSPISQTCGVSSGSGTVGGANITNVTVTCATNSFTVGGSVSGLAGGDSITLRNNGGDSLVRSANGSFTFTTPVASGQSYAVTVVSPTSPISQTCVVSSGGGTVGGANITNVTVACATNSFTVGGSVSGLGAGDSITLRNNGGDALDVAANGGFTFATPIASGQSYAVTVTSPSSPISQACSVTSATGTIGGVNITDVSVTCATNRFTVGGTVSGLAATDTITLRNNGGDNLDVTANGSFMFATPVASGQPYAVTVISPSSPVFQTCNVTNGTGIVGNVDVTNIAITCAGAPPSSGAFSYAATNTDNARQNTVDVDIPMVVGQVLTIGTCGVPGSSGEGDTFLRLFNQANVEVAGQDDENGACGLLTLFTFTAGTTETFRVHAGCFSSLACSGTVAYTLSGT